MGNDRLQQPGRVLGVHASQAAELRVMIRCPQSAACLASQSVAQEVGFSSFYCLIRLVLTRSSGDRRRWPRIGGLRYQGALNGAGAPVAQDRLGFKSISGVVFLGGGV